MKPTKTELRRQLKQTRLEMTDADRTLQSREIVKRLKQATDWSTIKTLHYFEPIHELLEPDIREFITELEDKYPDLQLSVSRLIGTTWQLVAARGAPAFTFDAIIVPMLGFDPASLHRIGYGGGYYDKFLATQLQAQKIGVCYEAGKTAHLPAEPYDVPLNLVITDSSVYGRV